MAIFNNVIVSITSGQQQSTAIDLQGFVLCGILVPAAFTGTAITFLLGDDLGNYYDIYDSSDTLITMKTTPGRAYLLSPIDFTGIKTLRVKSNAAEGAIRNITLITRLV